MDGGEVESQGWALRWFGGLGVWGGWFEGSGCVCETGVLLFQLDTSSCCIDVLSPGNFKTSKLQTPPYPPLPLLPPSLLSLPSSPSPFIPPPQTPVPKTHYFYSNQSQNHNNQQQTTRSIPSPSISQVPAIWYPTYNHKGTISPKKLLASSSKLEIHIYLFLQFKGS